MEIAGFTRLARRGNSERMHPCRPRGSSSFCADDGAESVSVREKQEAGVHAHVPGTVARPPGMWSITYSCLPVRTGAQGGTSMKKLPRVLLLSVGLALVTLIGLTGAGAAADPNTPVSVAAVDPNASAPVVAAGSSSGCGCEDNLSCSCACAAGGVVDREPDAQRGGERRQDDRREARQGQRRGRCRQREGQAAPQDVQIRAGERQVR